ncbi:hypothetical protein D3C86_1069530 [compost metagenome]
MRYIRSAPGREIVETDHLVTATQQAFAKMGTEKTGAAIDENTLARPPLGVDGDAVVMFVGNEITHYTLLPMRNQRS